MPSIFERFKLFKRPAVINVNLNGDASSQVLNLSAVELYQTQDNLRAVVDFISSSIAQLPLKVYRRDGETERVRDRDSAAAKLLWQPNAYQTAFDFISGLVKEYLVCGSVYVWLLPDADSDSGYQMYIVPNNWVISTQSSTTYGPDVIRICNKNGGTAVDVPRSEFVQFKTYSVGNPGGYISPISALKQTLQEQVEAGRFRRQLWRSSGRLNAQIIRPANVQAWDEKARERFITMFREAWGSGGSKAGQIPVLEDGMEIKPFSTSFKEQEWAASVRLSREAVAAAYGINASLVWHSDTQTYASARDNARALYAECLGPIIQMLQQRINAFLLPMIGANPNLYVEFDLSEKLKGSFEERAQIMQTATGRPWMTVDEARAEMNLPKLPNGQGEGLTVPLNVEVSGQANPGNDYDYPGVDNNSKKRTDCFEQFIKDVYKVAERNTIERDRCTCSACKSTEEIQIKGKADKEDDDKMSQVLSSFFKRQARSVIPKIRSGNDDFWDAERWDKELAEDMLPVLTAISDKHGEAAAEVLDWTYNADITRNYLEKVAQNRAKGINGKTLADIKKEMDAEEPDLDHTFEVRASRSDALGRAAAGAVAGFAITEATNQAVSAGAPSVTRAVVEKTWVTGPNARESHIAMNGETVPIDATFSNGMDWPGDDRIGDPDETCGCNCETVVTIRR